MGGDRSRQPVLIQATLLAKQNGAAIKAQRIQIRVMGRQGE